MTSTLLAEPRRAPSPDELYQLGDIIKFHRRTVSSAVGGKPFSSYALYSGRGCVIHAWSDSRTDFRVRVDSLRRLEATGLVAINITQTMDAYCERVLSVRALPRDEIVPRARKGLHCKTTSRDASVVLMLSARYGGIAIAMAKSLLMVLPHVFRAVRGEQVASNLVNAIMEAFSQRGPRVGATNGPAISPATDDERGRAFAAIVDQSCVLVMQSLRGIKSLLRSGIDQLLAQWIIVTLEKAVELPVNDGVTYGMAFHNSANLPVVLVFNRVVHRFVVVFMSDNTLLERLVRDRMECGICFTDFDAVRVTVFECSHFVCRSCFESLPRRVCPYCRKPVGSVREVTRRLKQHAYEAMRNQECQQMAINDVDASPPHECADGAIVPSSDEDPVSAIAGYAVDDEDNGENPEATTVGSVKDCQDREAMLAEDFNALAL